jgi:hypothetical protein
MLNIFEVVKKINVFYGETKGEELDKMDAMEKQMPLPEILHKISIQNTAQCRIVKVVDL